MSRRDHSFALAAGASVLVHAAIVFVVADSYVLGEREGDATARSAIAAARSTTTPPPASRPPPPPPEPEPTYVARPTASTPPPPPVEALFGEKTGTGDAANSRPGDEPMLARAGARQAFLSRDPVGSGDIMNPPSMSVLPTAATPAAEPMDAVAEMQPIGIAERVAKLSAPRVVRKPPQSNAPTNAVAEAKPNESRDAKVAAGVAPAGADPAIMSDSESDPFTKNGAVMFRDGRMEAKFGRKVKTVRPRLSLSSQYDLLAMQFPRIVVRAHLNGDGSVKRVEIVKSTGSASADQEVKVALYQWWFEPTRDDVVEFPMMWR
jgi:TonB family protein